MENSAFLTSLAASPMQRQIYDLILCEYQKNGIPVKNGFISRELNLFRTTVTFHLKNMLSKGMIERHGKQYYTPVFNPSTKGNAMSLKKASPKKAVKKPAAKKAAVKPAKKTAKPVKKKK